MSPGRVTTETPLRAMAFWMALCMTRGACSAVLISSEYTEHSVNSRSGWVSWKKPLPICLLGICEAMARTGLRRGGRRTAR